MGSVSHQTGRWVLDSVQEGISSLRYEPDTTFTADQVGPEEVLVEVHAASLNYRELAICRVSWRFLICATQSLTYDLSLIREKGQSIECYSSPGYSGRDPWLRWRGRGARSRLGSITVLAVAAPRRESCDTHDPPHRGQQFTQPRRCLCRSRPEAQRDTVPTGYPPPERSRPHAKTHEFRRGRYTDMLGTNCLERINGHAGKRSQRGRLDSGSGYRRRQCGSSASKS